MEFISELAIVEKTLWYIAIPATVLFIIMLVSTFVGIGDGDADVDIDHDTDIDHDHDGFNIWGAISFKNLINFFTFFSWGGLVLFDWNLPTILAVPIALILAIGFTLLLNLMFVGLLKLQADKTTKIEDAIDQTGEVYLTVPKGGKRTGKVEVVVNGAKRIYDAVSADNTIRTGNTVLVLDVNEKKQLIVAKDV